VYLQYGFLYLILTGPKFEVHECKDLLCIGGAYYVLYMARLISKVFSFFWAQMALTTLVAISGPKKVTILRPTPYGPRNGCGPPQDHYIPRHKNVKA
jgi:hypothetical protein